VVRRGARGVADVQRLKQLCHLRADSADPLARVAGLDVDHARLSAGLVDRRHCLLLRDPFLHLSMRLLHADAQQTGHPLGRLSDYVFAIYRLLHLSESATQLHPRLGRLDQRDVVCLDASLRAVLPECRLRVQVVLLGGSTFVCVFVRFKGPLGYACTTGFANTCLWKIITDPKRIDCVHRRKMGQDWGHRPQAP